MFRLCLLITKLLHFFSFLLINCCVYLRSILGYSTDACVPVSRLPEIIVQTNEDILASGFQAGKLFVMLY